MAYSLVYPKDPKFTERGKTNRETDEEHDEDCVQEGFQLARVKYHRDGEGGR